MKNENVMKMAEVIRRARQELRSGLILPEETATALHKAGYRKEKEVVREFGERAIKPISQVEQTASVREKNAENDYLKNYFQGYRIGCATAIIKIKEVAKEFGVEEL